MKKRTKWVSVCRRTNDPKLAHFESVLSEAKIPHRRNGESFHAPILEVPAQFEGDAWQLLSKKVRGRSYDDVPDDAPMFRKFERNNQHGLGHDWPDQYERDANGWIKRKRNSR